jgi:hypothetical protein
LADRALRKFLGEVSLHSEALNAALLQLTRDEHVVALLRRSFGQSIITSARTGFAKQL